MSIDTILKELFSTSPLPNKLKQPKNLFNKGNLGYASKIRIVKEYTDYKVKIMCVKSKTIDELLEEIFNQTPLPNSLKHSKRRFYKNELGHNSKIRIVSKNSDWDIDLTCYEITELI